MRKSPRWLSTRVRRLIALAAAGTSVAWAANVALQDFAVSQRAEMLRSADPDERLSALLDITVLVASDPRHARPAMPLVLRAVNDPVPYVRAQALITLSDLAAHPRAHRLDPGANALARRLTVQHLNDPSSEVRAAALGSLARLGPTDAQALPALLRLARLPEGPFTRAGAIVALGRFDPPSSTARQMVMELTRDREIVVRVTAVQTLGAWASHDLNVTRAILLGLDDPDQRVRFAAYEALRGLGRPSPELLPELLGMLECNDKIKACIGAELLGRMGPQAAKVSHLLLAAQQRHEPENWASPFTLALAQVAPDSAEGRRAIVALTNMLEGVPPTLASSAADTLGDFRACAAEAIPALRRAAASEHRDLRYAARRALREIEADLADGP